MPLLPIPNSNSEDAAPVREFNPCHEPGGSPVGGRFAAKGQGNCAGIGTVRPDLKPVIAEHRLATKLAAKIRQNARTDAEREHAHLIALAEVRSAQHLRNGDTMSRYMVTQPDGTRAWTPERLKVHEAVIAQYLDDLARKVGRPLSAGLATPTVLVMAGLPGAGKSTAVKTQLDTSDAVVSDSDALKSYLLKHEGLDASQATVVHAESTYLADVLIEVALARRMNLVIDGTMKTAGRRGAGVRDGAFGKLEAFKAAGFQVEAILVDVTTEQSVQRAVTRFAEEWKRHGTGRYVPPWAIRQVHTDTDGVPKGRKTFGLVRDYKLEDGRYLLDAWTEFDGWTSTRRAGRGTHRMVRR